MDIARELNIRLGGAFTVFPDGISGELMTGLRLLTAAKGERRSADDMIKTVTSSTEHDVASMGTLEEILRSKIIHLENVRKDINQKLDTINDKKNCQNSDSEIAHTNEKYVNDSASDHKNTLGFSLLLQLTQAKLDLLVSCLRWSVRYSASIMKN
jgi:hypothetical protein